MLITNFDLINLRSKLNGIAEVKVLNELFMEVPRGLRFPRGHVLFEPFDRKLVQLIQAGIVQRLVKSYYDLNMARIKKGPAVLTLQHLELGFQIWLFFLALSTIAFIAEILIFWRRHAKELLLSVYINIIFRSILSAFKCYQ